MLSDAPWHQRLAYLFDIFKCSSNDMAYDDVVMACQVVAMSLHRLWGLSVGGEWDHSKWSKVNEAVADGAFTKVMKDCNDLNRFYTSVLPLL